MVIGMSCRDEMFNMRKVHISLVAVSGGRWLVRFSSSMARSPAGDPCAYLIRGALIALRQADAREIALCPAHQRGA